MTASSLHVELTAGQIEAFERVRAFSNLSVDDQIEIAIEDWLELRDEEFIGAVNEALGKGLQPAASPEEIEMALRALWQFNWRSRIVDADMNYVVIIERGETNFTATVPDLPGVLGVGDTEAEAHATVCKAIGRYLAELRAAGDPVPEPRCTVTMARPSE